MKRINLLLAVTGMIIFSFSGCEKLLDKIGVTIDSDYTNVAFTVNPDKAGTYSEIIEVVNSNLDSIIDAEGQEVGELNSVKIKDAMIQVVGEGDLDPFESFRITLEAPDKDAIKVAEVTSVPEGITEIILIKEGVDLSDYLKSDQYTIKVKTVLDQDLETHMIMRARVRYEIKVGL